MRTISSLGAVSVLTAVLVGPIHAQDSVGKGTCLPGDAVSPWDDASATNGSEQCNSYVLDLVPFTTSWGTRFGIGPLMKGSKSGSAFFSSVINAQTMSRRQVNNSAITGSYSLWTTPGAGVNNDAAINDPGTPVSNIPNGNLFATSFAEFGTTDSGHSYSGIVTGLVRYDPTNSGRLYVDRVMSAVNGDCSMSELGSMSIGSVDANGTVIFRADSFSTTGLIGTSCAGGLAQLSDNNIFMLDNRFRDCDVRNVISNDFLTGGAFDPALLGASRIDWLIRADSEVHNVPNIGNVGGTPYYLGSDFNSNFVRGPAFGSITSNITHFAPGTADHRGNVSRLEQNHAALGSTNGLCAIIGDDGGATTIMNVWGIDGSGNVSGTLGLAPPAVILDPITGDSTDGSGTPEFDHYHSQVPFQGGNGQIAMNIDADGNLLVAAIMDSPSDGGSTWPFHIIPVAKVTPAGAVSWTVAGYNISDSSGPSGGLGKPILSGPGGSAIGRLTSLDMVTGTPLPSMSAPMIDSAGNIYFISAVEIFGTPSNFTVGLVRAVYDPTRCGYELDLMLTPGTTFTGANSGRDYLIRYFTLSENPATGNSISSGSAWSGNIQEVGHNGQEHPTVATDDSLHLGGIVIHAGIIYDADNDGDFERCIGSTPVPGSGDQDYEVVLYIGSLQDCQLDLGFAGPGNSQFTLCGTGLNAGESSTVSVTGAPPSAAATMLISFPGFANVPFAGGTLVSFAGFSGAQLPIGTDSNGEINFTLAGIGAPSSLVFQFAILDFAQPGFLQFSNAINAVFGQ